MLFIFSMPMLIRHLWQMKTVVFLHWCLIRAVLLSLIWPLHSIITVLILYFKFYSAGRSKKDWNGKFFFIFYILVIMKIPPPAPPPQ